jgi:hypothetical protein
VSAGVTDKTIKVTGVTSAFEVNATETDVMHIGRWKTSAMALRYKLNSYAFKRSVAMKVPPLS